LFFLFSFIWIEAGKTFQIDPSASISLNCINRRTGIKYIEAEI
jgi:hypothetical protein